MVGLFNIATMLPETAFLSQITESGQITALTTSINILMPEQPLILMILMATSSASSKEAILGITAMTAKTV